MKTMETGLGGTVSIEIGALIVAVASSILVLAVFYLAGRDFLPSLLEATIGGFVVGVTFYIGLRARAKSGAN